MDGNIKTLNDEFNNKGIQIFSDIYSSQELDEIENILFKNLKKIKSVTPFTSSKNYSNCSYTIPELNKLIFNDRLIEKLKLCLGSEKLMYTSVLGVQKDMLSGWHKDDGTTLTTDNGYFLKDPYNDETCRVLRVGIYFQDHNKDHPGTHFKFFSHKKRDLDTGETSFVEGKRGCVSIFDVRLTHSGTFRSKLYNSVINISPNKLKPKVVVFLNMIRSFWLKMTNKHKLTVWTAFGVSNHNTINYSKTMMKGQLIQSGGHWNLPLECSELLESKGIELASKHFNDTDFQN